MVSDAESAVNIQESQDGNVQTEEDLLALHKKQRKDLQAKVQALKKSATKGDKKKKKEVTEEIARLEAELDAKQSQELDSFKQSATAQLANDISNVCLENQEEMSIPESSLVPRLTKTQKRREKKSNKEKERETLILLQETENLQGKRHIETQKIKARLRSKGLQILEVPSDGNCMYASLVHQLNNETHKPSTAELRQLTAQYMLNHVDEFLPFLDDPETGDEVDLPAYQKYCCKIEQTAAWGGHLELRALSHVLKRPLEVTQAEGPELIIGEEYDKAKPLRLAYHRHMYGLGEHYNSVEPCQEEQTDIHEG